MPIDPNDLYRLRRRPPSEKQLDTGFHWLTVLTASTVAIVLVLILAIVFHGSLESMGLYGWRFLVTSNWNPVDDEYGALTAIYGTMVTSLVSLLIAVPLGVGTAIFITERFIPRPLREIIGLMVELLAAIPSVVLGLWAIFVLEPALRPFLTWLHVTLKDIPLFSTQPLGPGMTPAILVLVVMILPIITAISRDSLNQVPIRLRQAAYGVGSTQWSAILHVILPASIS